MTEAAEVVPGEDLDGKIRELYTSSNPETKLPYTYREIVKEVGHSKAYVIGRITRMVKWGELTLRHPRS